MARASPKFAILFIAALLAVSAGVFFTFSFYQRQMFAQRRAQSEKNLAAIGRAIETLASEHGGNYPDNAFAIVEKFANNPSVLFHPSWPDQLGYVYIFGARSSDDPVRTVLVFENVPPAKRKVGTQVLFLNGSSAVLNEADFEALLEDQQKRWHNAGNRDWRTQEIGR